jgi:hypothetical protein
VCIVYSASIVHKFVRDCYKVTRPARVCSPSSLSALLTRAVCLCGVAAVLVLYGRVVASVCSLVRWSIHGYVLGIVGLVGLMLVW